jgi:hypothetical protein
MYKNGKQINQKIHVKEMTLKYIDTVTHFRVAKTQWTESHLLYKNKA